MTTDPRTIAAYEARAADYAARFAGGDAPSESLQRFADALPPGGRILDLGCGPGTSSLRFIQMGFAVDALDATPAMVGLARSRGVPARLGTFDDLDAVAAHDGVWANFSLLHAPRAALPRHLAAIARALRPGGLLHLGMKTGSGEARDRLDRFYTFVTVPEITALLTGAGFTILATDEGEEIGLAGTSDPFVILRART